MQSDGPFELPRVDRQFLFRAEKGPTLQINWSELNLGNGHLLHEDKMSLRVAQRDHVGILKALPRRMGRSEDGEAWHAPNVAFRKYIVQISDSPGIAVL